MNIANHFINQLDDDRLRTNSKNAFKVYKFIDVIKQMMQQLVLSVLGSPLSNAAELTSTYAQIEP